MTKICGFQVVRKPAFASRKLEEPNLQLGEKIYHGVDRFPWEDFAVAYYDRRLPAALFSIWQELQRSSIGFLAPECLADYEQAREVLRFSGPTSELIAIWSPELEQIRGAPDCAFALEYLGMDCICLGEWSVIRDGVYLHPDQFPETIPKLNPWGLLTSDSDCKELADRYLELSATEIVEPPMENPKFANVRVFRAL
jgi:hypothetical protein